MRRRGRKHGVIPDGQVKPGVPVSHFRWAGRYFAEKRPDVIVNLGDWYDLESLCEYDRLTKARHFAQRSYQRDLDAGDRALDLFDNAIGRVSRYNPRRVWLLGNHDNRAQRLINADPRLEGALSLPWEKAEEHGWEVYDYLEPVTIDGVTYCHQFVKSSNGRVGSTKWGAPNARAQVLREMRSCTAGHTPGLSVHIQPAGARSLYGLICGSFYAHAEEYATPQGNRHWRGIVIKHEVRGGEYDPMFVSLSFLKRRFG